MPQPLPALLEELHNKLCAVDTTVEDICLIMARRIITNEVPVPLGELAKLCGLLQLVRESVLEIESFYE